MRRHLFVCTNDRASGKPACGARGSVELLAAVQTALVKRGSGAPGIDAPGIDALATACACLGPCFDGPNAVVYPDGVWYGALEPSDAESLVRHLVDGDGTALAAKRLDI